MSHLLRPLFGTVARSWHMYPVVFLFGLGFDMATEVGLLGVAAAEAAQGLSWRQTLLFPALFTAGMALADTTDSVLMVAACGWAFTHPLRKLWDNLTITATSVLVALLIGGLEVLGMLAARLGLNGGFWSAVADLNDDLAKFGFAVVGIFVVAREISALVHRWRGYEQVMATVRSSDRRGLWAALRPWALRKARV